LTPFFFDILTPFFFDILTPLFFYSCLLPVFVLLGFTTQPWQV